MTLINKESLLLVMNTLSENADPSVLDWEFAVDVVRTAPEADPVRHGKWVDAWRSAMDGTRHWHRECSECGYERDDDNIDKDTKFCPNCGAMMDGERRDDE